MTGGIYRSVVCFSQCGVGLRNVFWCETPWRNGHYTTPHCTLDI